MAGLILSFMDQFPTYNGNQIEIRGTDGYFNASGMSRVLKKRLTDWKKTKFAQELLDELSIQSGMLVEKEVSSTLGEYSQGERALIEYETNGNQAVWLHPYVALSYAMSNARFQARINIWIINLVGLGTVNPHILQWTQEELARGIQYNRDDIEEMYPRDR